MNAIGLKNFRNFRELPMLQTNGVAIFVGGNNAGKSTCTMAYRLMAQNLMRIISGAPFDGNDRTFGTHKFNFSPICGDFERALSHYADSNIIDFNIKLGYFDISVKVTADKNTQSMYDNVVSIVIYDTIDNCSWEWNSSDKKNTIFRYSGHTLAQIVRLLNAKGLLDRFSDEQKISIRENILKYEKKKVTYEYKDTYSNPFEFHSCKVILDGEHTDIIPSGINDVNESLEPIGDFKVFQDFFAYIRKDLEKACNPNNIKYIPARGTTLDSYFRINNNDSDSYANDICRFYKLDSYDLKCWIRSMMKELGIGENFDIEKINSDFLYVTITNKNGIKVPLADNGRGAVQLFRLLLLMAMNADMPINFAESQEYGYKRIIIETENEFFPNGKDRILEITKLLIVEEPEQNLHPALQSKLADIFLSLHQEYGVNILVETHSEYLVRRSQVLVAEAKYKDEQELAEKCPFNVYYFPEIGSGKPYDMEFRCDGRFKQDFGDGFYDEADKLAYKIM
ncbi:MAG: AAA family ATPase [Paludibacteraceae bacterium]|nr:AAA family ATPase [Paludibacteraceae bacterium]